MPFCENCGNELNGNERFCSNCGTETKLQDDSKRKTVFEGEIHKCPNCGEIIKSFELRCSSCGLEIRGRDATNSIKEFSLKLEKINSNMKNKKTSLFRQDKSKTDEQLINLIRSFSIPNNKEDIFEFIILASSNVNYEVYGMGDKGIFNESQRAISEAWIAKLEQAYQKAELSFGNDKDFIKIKSLYEKTTKKLARKKKEVLFFCIATIFVPLLIILLVVLLIPSTPPDESRNSHLEYVVEQIEDDIVEGKYDDARNKAYTLTFDEELDHDKHEYWEKKQKEILEQINKASGME